MADAKVRNASLCLRTSPHIRQAALEALSFGWARNPEFEKDKKPVDDNFRKVVTTLLDSPNNRVLAGAIEASGLLVSQWMKKPDKIVVAKLYELGRTHPTGPGRMEVEKCPPNVAGSTHGPADGTTPLVQEADSLGSSIVVLLESSKENAPRRRCFESRWRPRHERQHLQGAVVDPFGPTTAILYTPLGPNANRCHRCRFQVINITARQRFSTTPARRPTKRCRQSRPSTKTGH